MPYTHTSWVLLGKTVLSWSPVLLVVCSLSDPRLRFGLVCILARSVSEGQTASTLPIIRETMTRLFFRGEPMKYVCTALLLAMTTITVAVVQSREKKKEDPIPPRKIVRL